MVEPTAATSSAREVAGEPLILWDRSRATRDWECERARYLNYEFSGRGIVPEAEAYELAFGTAAHTAIANIAQGHLAGDIDIDRIAVDAANAVRDHLAKAGKLADFVNEQSCLIEGMIRGFHLHMWPRLMAQYPKILAIEQEMSYAFGATLFMAKPDLVVADTEGAVVYLEMKTTSSKKEEWINSWNSAIQLHATSRAIEASLGEAIGAVQVIGLYKGWLNYGKQGSPFCYAYRRNGSPPFSKDEVSYEYKAGFRRNPVWEQEGGVKSWVASMPMEVLSNQFPCTPPIFVRDDLVERFFHQRNIREQEIQMALTLLDGMPADDQIQLLDTAFPQNFSKCRPSWGHSCPYEIICHGSISDPLKAGFLPRVSHHLIEVATHQAEDQDEP